MFTTDLGWVRVYIRKKRSLQFEGSFKQKRGTWEVHEETLILRTAFVAVILFANVNFRDRSPLEFLLRTSCETDAPALEYFRALNICVYIIYIYIYTYLFQV